MNKRVLPLLFATILLPHPVRSQNEVGFLERFALAPDRSKVLEELVPGSEDYYFFHALHYQNTRDTARLADIMEKWQKRFRESAVRHIIENREALLSYENDPQGTLEYLREQLGVEFNDVQELRDSKPDLPSHLEAGKVSRSVFEAEALENDDSLAGFSPAALEALVVKKASLNPAQRKALLTRLERPDVPGLLELVVEDLRSRESRGFGEFAIHRALLPDQLEALAKAIPSLATTQSFVYSRLRKLAPSAEADLQNDPQEREAWLDRVWAVVNSLPSSFNSIKTHVLYQRLDHDRKQGVYDRSKLLEYVKLPRQATFLNPRWLERNADRSLWGNLSTNLSEALVQATPISASMDEALVREYLLALFVREGAPAGDIETSLSPWKEFVRDTWLKPLFAEAMILSGQGNAEKWASLLTPSEFQRLKERVDISFPATNPQYFLPGDDVRFDVVLKNTPNLIVKLYEINTLNFFLTQRRQLNTDLNLDGLVANSEQTKSFARSPFLSSRETFAFPELKGRRGAWVIEFIGGGRSSRVLVRVGQWQVLQRTGPAGDVLQVINEKDEPVSDAVAWIDGRRIAAEEKTGRILVPFTRQSGTKPLIVTDNAGEFATLTQFEHHTEDPKLDVQFHVEREQLLSGREATLTARVSLMLGDLQLDPELLEAPVLVVTCTTQDGIATNLESKGLKLDAHKVLTHLINVPERLAKLQVTLSAKVAMTSSTEHERSLSTSKTWEINAMDRSEAVSDGYFSSFQDGHVFELLGKNGEPLADQQIVFNFKHRDFTRTIAVPLSTDSKGRVNLGTLPGIDQITAKSPNHRQSTWVLNDYVRTWQSTIHAQQGSTVRVPVPAGFNIEEGRPSLMEVRAGTFTTDLSSNLAVRDGFLVIDGLPAGDYSLRLKGENRGIDIKVSGGKLANGWLLGRNRSLQFRGEEPLQIISVAADEQFVTVRLAHTTPFTRVHVAASRFHSGTSLFDGLAGFTRFGSGAATPARMPNLYAGGRQIGDEHRYILERRYAKIYPGNMLTRPGLLLNPWETQETDLEELNQNGGEAAGTTRGGSAGFKRKAAEEPVSRPAAGTSGDAAGTNLDFLARSAPALYNLTPDKDGVVRIARASLGDRQEVQVYAENLTQAVWQKISLPEVPTAFADQRLAKNLEPTKPFTQKKETTVLMSGQTLTLEDRLTSRFEVYDSLAGVHSLFATLSNDSTLAAFTWILDWPNLSAEAKLVKYGENACHELNFFLSRKDPAFFESVIKPYLQHKKDKTFMDNYLLGTDLKPYLEPWSHARLNAAEQALLAQRIPSDAPHAARRLREAWEMLPPNQDDQNRLFETALHGRVLDSSARYAGATSEKEAADKALGGPAPMPAPVPMAAAPADAFAAGGGAPVPRPAFALSTRARPESEGAAAPSAMAEEESAKGLIPAQPQLLGIIALTSGNTFSGFVSGDEVKTERAKVRSYYKQTGPAKEWAENNYYHLPITGQDASLIPVNAFWRDFAAWVADGAKGPFVSAHVAEASRNFAEMMLALAVLDLPFNQPDHLTAKEGAKFELTASGPAIIFHQEIKPASAPEDDSKRQLLVSQSFFRHDDRFRHEGNEQIEKNVTGEFLTGTVYGASIVVTNPSGSPAKAEVLMQIPQGSIPVLDCKATDSHRLFLEPYTTQTFEYYFYFPTVPLRTGERFAHYPVHASVSGTEAGHAALTLFTVVNRLTEVDKNSWDYISQEASEADVFAFLDKHNLENLDLGRLAWRCRSDAAFYAKLTAYLKTRHVWEDSLARYALLHNDTGTLRELLKLHYDNEACGPYLKSTLLVLDPIERRFYEHLEYSPLVNQRAHRLGSEWRIANPVVLEQYQSLLAILAHKPGLDAVDSMSVVYYLFLQDRIEEALVRLKSIDPGALPTRLQHDYLRCYAAFYQDALLEARTIAAQYAHYPVPRWAMLFNQVLSQIAEIEGGTPAPEGKSSNDGQERQAGLAASEPGFDYKVEDRAIRLTWRNLEDVTLNYYLMDPEFAFSSSPFVSEDASRFSIVKPAFSARQVLPKGKDALELPLPQQFARANVLVEVIGAGQRKAQAYHANTLRLALTENYGLLEARDSGTGRALPKAYVKVYAKLRDGSVRFFKDGYTDLRGRFEYASLNSGSTETPPAPTRPTTVAGGGLDHPMLKPSELDAVEKLAVLILSENNGATVRETSPPSQ